MDDFFQNLNDLSNKEDQIEAIKTGRQQLGQIEGDSRLDFAWKLLRWAELYHSKKIAEEIINDVLGLAEKTATEEAALLLVHRASYDIFNSDIPEATHYADLALKKSRDIRSDKAEAKALEVKGLLSQVKMEYKKTNAWYYMALDKCTELQRPGIMLGFGHYLILQGEYSQAWSFINQAKSLANDLSEDLPPEDIEKKRLKKIVAEAYWELGRVHEGLEDFDAALRAYDQALLLSMQYGFTKVFPAISYAKANAHRMLGNSAEFIAAVQKVYDMKHESKDIDRDLFLQQVDGWARWLKITEEYEDALTEYKKILFEDITDTEMSLSDFIDNQTNKFLKIVKGIALCLHATDRITESETISKEEALFCELIQQTGRDNIGYRNYKLQIQKKRLIAELRRIFFKLPVFVEYKNIQAKYDPVKDKAIFKIDNKEIKRAKRYFLVFKCLVENAGEKVSGEMLDDFVIKQGEPINKKDSGLRVYVGRLIKDINLAQFLVPHEGKGWKLQAP